MKPENDVFELDEGETAGCYFCMKSGDYTEYRRGEVYLAGPLHTPCDGNANYICRKHLDSDAVIYKPKCKNIA